MIVRIMAVITAYLLVSLFASECQCQTSVELSIPDSESVNAASVGGILTLSMTTGAPGGLCALDLRIACAGCADYRIQSVTLHPALALVVAEELVSPPEGPALRYHTCRAQPPETIDLSLGADGGPIELGVIELEVLSDAGILPPLSITAKVATIGRNRQPTVVYVTDGTNILNADAAPSDTAQIFLTPQDAELASAAEPGSGDSNAGEASGMGSPQGEPAEPQPAEVAEPALTQDDIDTLTAAVEAACADSDIDSAECQALLDSVLPAGEP